MSRPDPELIAAWRSSEYRVEGDDRCLILHVDQAHDGLAALMRDCHVQCAAYLTADNPHGKVAEDDANRAARRHLHAYVERGAWYWLPGLGIDPRGDHPGEHSVLVLGMDEDEAVEAGRHFEQLAILVIGADAVPRLRMVDDASGTNL